MILSIFHVPVGHLYLFFGEMSSKVFCPFLDWNFFFCCWVVWSVCIFWKLSLCWLCHLQIFSPILWVVFFMVSFPVQKLISLIRAQLSIYLFFISIALGDWSKKTWILKVELKDSKKDTKTNSFHFEFKEFFKKTAIKAVFLLWN